jgi:hypothetical protein
VVDAGAHGQCALSDPPFGHGIAQPPPEVALGDPARQKKVVHDVVTPPYENKSCVSGAGSASHET